MSSQCGGSGGVGAGNAASALDGQVGEVDLGALAVGDAQAGQRDVGRGAGSSGDGDLAAGELRTTQGIGLGVDGLVDGDGLAGIGADLEQLAGERAVQQLGAVEVRLLGDAVDFADQLGHFGLQGLAVAGGVGGVGGLHRQLADALQVVADFGQRTFGDLGQRDTVVGIADGDVGTADLRAEALGDRQTGGVVLGAVDARTGGQALDGGGQRAAAGAQVTLSIQRHRIGVDDLCHGAFPLAKVERVSGSGRRVMQRPEVDQRVGISAAG